MMLPLFMCRHRDLRQSILLGKGEKHLEQPADICFFLAAHFHWNDSRVTMDPEGLRECFYSCDDAVIGLNPFTLTDP